MKKSVITLSLATLFSTPSFATQMDESFKGHRLGVGLSNTIQEFSSTLLEVGQGFHVEYGYDWNKVASLSVGYNTTHLDNPLSTGKAKTLLVGLDLGYAFVFDSWAIKPYGSIGYAHANGDIKNYGWWADEDITGSDASAYIGMGMMTTFKNGLYLNIQSNTAYLFETSVFQATVSIGYKF